MGLATPTIEMMLGGATYGTLRRFLTDRTDTVAVWPLSEVVSTTARNIVSDVLNGTYATATISRGQTVDIPEGALGARFSGGYVEVADDSAALRELNMSLSGGGMDIIFLFQGGSTSDATLDCIVQKQNNVTAGNGWHVGIQNGAVEFALRSGGVSIFNFQRGNIDDGALHLVHCCYDPSVGEAKIFIDGSQSGATVSGLGTEPQVTSAVLRIGAFSDGSGTLGGPVISYVMIGRRGDTSFAAIMQSLITWTDVTSDVRLEGVEWQYGIPGSNPEDRVASTGTLQFVMDNDSGGTLGYYTPGHPNVRTGFDLGIPVRLRVTYGGNSKWFRGYIKSVTPDAGQETGARGALVTCTDWMDVAAEAQLTGLTAQTDILASSAFGQVLDRLDRPPCSVSITTSTSAVFPYAFDNSQSESMTALTEFQRICQSEFGRVAIQNHDGQIGGILKFWDRLEPQATATTATFDNSMNELELIYDRDTMINRAEVTVTKRTAGATSIVLYSLGSQLRVAAGETAIIRGTYVDPSATDRRIGSFTITPPVATTDYTMIEAYDGTDITSSFRVTAQTGGNAVRFDVTNTGTRDGLITLLQLRGNVTYTTDSDIPTYEDVDSIKRYGPRTWKSSMPYHTANNQGMNLAKYVVNARSGLIGSVSGFRFVGDRSVTLMTAAMQVDIGHVVKFREGMGTGSTYQMYWIQRISYTWLPGGFLGVQWDCAPINAEGAYFILDTTDHCELDGGAILAFL